MNYNIVTYPQFEKELKRLAKKYKSLKSDFVTFLQELQENPNEGAQLGHGLRKVRMSIASKGKGKSGGARVITLTAIVDVESTEIGLLYVYDKSERESITDKELQKIIKANGL